MRKIKIGNQEEKGTYFLLVVIVVLSITSFAFTLSASGIYSGIYLLPLSFLIFNMVFFNVYKNVSICHLIVIILMTIRYVVSPLVLSIEGYPKLDTKFYVFDRTTVMLTISLMIYEMFALLLALYVNNKRKKNISYDKNIDEFGNDYNFRRLNPLTIGIVIFTIALFIIFPTLKNTYRFVLSENLDAYMGVTKEKGNLPFGINWLGYMLGEITRFILMEWILFRFYEKYKQNGKGRYRWFSMVLISVNALFASDRIAVGLILSLVYYMKLYKLYPQYQKKLRLFVVVVGSTVVLMIGIFYLGYAIKMGSLSQAIQSYTGGYREVYQSLCAYATTDLSLFDRIEMFLLGDVISNMAVISSFFKSELSSVNIYNYYLNQSTFNSGRIVPLVAQSTYYFTFVLGPWISYMCLRVMNRFEIRYMKGKKSTSINLYAGLLLAVTPFMYNLSVMIHLLTNVILPLFLVSEINRRIIFKKR